MKLNVISVLLCIACVGACGKSPSENDSERFKCDPLEGRVEASEEAKEAGVETYGYRVDDSTGRTEVDLLGDEGELLGTFACALDTSEWERATQHCATIQRSSVGSNRTPVDLNCS
jgi:hypothetical protein